MKSTYFSLVITLLFISYVQSDCLLECCQTLYSREPMEYIFYQDTGRFIGGLGLSQISTFTYSGNGDGYLNPDNQCLVNVGVLPVNTYVIGLCKDTMHDETVIAPCSFYLEPQDESTMCGRNDFFIHGCECCTEGDTTVPPAPFCSAGCIIMNIQNRQKLRVGDVVQVQRKDPLGYDMALGAKSTQE